MKTTVAKVRTRNRELQDLVRRTVRLLRPDSALLAGNAGLSPRVMQHMIPEQAEGFTEQERGALVVAVTSAEYAQIDLYNLEHPQSDTPEHTELAQQALQQLDAELIAHMATVESILRRLSSE